MALRDARLASNHYKFQEADVHYNSVLIIIIKQKDVRYASQAITYREEFVWGMIQIAAHIRSDQKKKFVLDVFLIIMSSQKMDFVKQEDLDAFISMENVYHAHLHLRKALTPNV